MSTWTSFVKIWTVSNCECNANFLDSRGWTYKPGLDFKMNYWPETGTAGGESVELVLELELAGSTAKFLKRRPKEGAGSRIAAMAATPALSPMLDWPPRGSSSVSPSESGSTSSSKIISVICNVCVNYNVLKYFVVLYSPTWSSDILLFDVKCHFDIKE